MMHRSLLSHLLPCLFSSLLVLLSSPGAGAQTSNPKPQTIYMLTAFQEQQLCVQSCFTYGYGCTTDLVGMAIGCSADSCDFTSAAFGALDSCYCRGDLQLAAESYLTSCIQESCTVGDTSINIGAAVSIYGGYCTSLGYTAVLPADNVAQTTAPNSNPSSTNNNNGGAASTSDIFASNPTSNSNDGSSSSSDGSSSGSSSPSSGSSSSSSNTTTYIVLGVMGGFALILLVLAGLWWRKYRKLKRAQAQAAQFRYGAAPPPMHYGYNNSNGSGQPLRPMGGGGSEVSSHPFFNRQDDIYPDDSVSTIHMAPAYPHPMEPSLVSTQMR
ncbi:hypothetical protein AYL99_02714 [Fonsecaea erecta]|uniref:Extracellular membrane protein CFEM domain-containing protein n=1 Tax=Fonsecaea erecta TaxID=1367422 RepID=A0A178ZUQ2_9EURO|nr:hypothetical protein AYL99_02714 [Fonsecaea erecta]OAP63487.1 hypothetical protein AYL99_02714 [Fonsecaea erecta]